MASPRGTNWRCTTYANAARCGGVKCAERADGGTLHQVKAQRTRGSYLSMSAGGGCRVQELFRF
ncbi:MAG: hypothetical protein QM775_05205 [Pirellulales bacterium]